VIGTGRRARKRRRRKGEEEEREAEGTRISTGVKSLGNEVKRDVREEPPRARLIARPTVPSRSFRCSSVLLSISITRVIFLHCPAS